MDELRVVHIGLGPIGLEIARLVAARPALSAVAAFDVDPELTGRSLAELTGIATAADLLVEPSFRLGPGSADLALHSTGSSLEEVAPQLLGCIEGGLPVISTCEELSYPWRTQPDLAGRLDRAARDTGVALLGTGVNPGFAMDYLAVVLAGSTAAVERVHVHRVQDAGTRRLPLQRKVGAGLTVAEFEEKAAAGSVRHVGLVESVHAVGQALGLDLSDTSETIEPVIADRNLVCGIGDVATGRVAGIRQIARGHTEAGNEVVTLVLEMAVGLTEPRDEVSITGSPDLRMVIPGGLPGDTATAAVVVNSIPGLLSAEPGLRTMAELPPPRP